MKKTTLLYLHIVMLSITSLLTISSSDAQCLAPTLGMYPEYVVTPTVCEGQTQIISEDSYAGEFSMINVTAGQTYTFHSSIPTGYFTITVDTESTEAHGTAPLTWVATVSGSVYLVYTIDSNCTEDTDYTTPATLSFTCGELPTDEAPDAVSLSPSSAIVSGSQAAISGQVFEAGLTDVAPNIAGQAPGIQMWVGVSPEGENSSPETWTDWIAAVHNPAHTGTSDEYIAQVGWNLAPGTYYYATRFKLNDGYYVYGGIDASENGGFWDGTTFVSGVLTVSIPQNSLAGLYNVVTTRLDNGSVYSWQNEMIDYTGINWYKTKTVGPYYIAGGNPGTGATVVFPSDALGGYTFMKISNVLFVPSQNLGAYYSNLVSQTSPQYNSSTYNPSTGVLTIEYNIYYSTGNLNFRSVYTPQFLSTNEYTSSSVKYFPNPVKEILHLSQTYQHSELTLFTVTGQRVMSKNLNSNVSQIDLSQLSQGVYIARLISDDQTQTFKIIKE